jgi:hypothetical protein
MQKVNAIKDGVAYIGWKESGPIMHLYKWKDEVAIEDFQAELHKKLERKTRNQHAVDTTKKAVLRAYLNERVPPIAALLDITVVTDFKNDHLLTVKTHSAYFVYFGAMTKHFVHVACWLRIPLKNRAIDTIDKPKIFFWVLHISYAQELEALGDYTKPGIDMKQVRKLLDVSNGIHYDDVQEDTDSSEQE